MHFPILYLLPILGTSVRLQSNSSKTAQPFDIDVVFTWVPEPSSEDFASIDKYCGHIKGGIKRFRELGVFRFSLRMIDLYMPWVRTIFVVTPRGATPTWLNTNHPRIKVIHQKVLFPPDKIERIMPVHNSQQVEVHLHRIPGLAEHFIYFNDDMFPGRPLQPSFFFSDDGKPVYWKWIPLAEEPIENFRYMEHPGHVMGWHVAYPLTISMIQDMQATWPAVFDRVESAHCRGDIPIGDGPPWLYLWFGVQSGHMAAQPPGRFSMLGDRNVANASQWYAEQISDPPDLACINDDFETEDASVFNRQSMELQSYIAKASGGHTSLFELEAVSKDQSWDETNVGH